MAKKVKETKLTAKVKRHQEIVQGLNSLYEQKNLRYGDSFSTTYKEYGPEALLLRLDDKLNRLKSLIRNGYDPQDESLIDTLEDMANYAILGIMELENEAVEQIIENEIEDTHRKLLEGCSGTGVSIKTVDSSPDTEVVKDNTIAEELEEFSKAEVDQIGTALGLTFKKKTSKEKMIEKILSDCSPEAITDIIDNLFEVEDTEEDNE